MNGVYQVPVSRNKPASHSLKYNLHFTAYSYHSILLCYTELLSGVQLTATPWTAARQAPLSMKFSQARILEWVAISSSRGSSQPRDQTQVSYVSPIGRQFFTASATWGAHLGTRISQREMPFF